MSLSDSQDPFRSKRVDGIGKIGPARSGAVRVLFSSNGGAGPYLSFESKSPGVHESGPGKFHAWDHSWLAPVDADSQLVSGGRSESGPPFYHSAVCIFHGEKKRSASHEAAGDPLPDCRLHRGVYFDRVVPLGTGRVDWESSAIRLARSSDRRTAFIDGGRVDYMANCCYQGAVRSNTKDLQESGDDKYNGAAHQQVHAQMEGIGAGPEFEIVLKGGMQEEHFFQN